MAGSFRIGQRLHLLQLLVGLGILGLLWVYLSTHGAAADGAAVSQQADREVTRAQSVLTALLGHKQGLNRFLAVHDEASLTGLRALEGPLTGAVDDLAAASPAVGDASRGAIDAYRAIADKATAAAIELGLTEDLGLQKELRHAVQAVEKRLDQAITTLPDAQRPAVDRLLVTLLMMRRHEKDFMLRGGRDRYMELIARRRTEFASALAGSPFDPAMRETLTGLLDRYTADLNRYADTASAQSAALQEADRRFDAARALIETAAREAAGKAAAVREEVSTQQDRLHGVMIGAVAAVLAVMIIGAQLITRSITRPLHRLTARMGGMANGDLATPVPGGERRDEPGEMARAVEVFRQGMLENERLRTDQDRQREEAEHTKNRALVAMAETVEQETGKVVRRIGEETTSLDRTARSMAAAAGKVSGNAQGVAAAAEQALGNTQTVASAAEQLNASIREIATRVAQTSTIARRALDGGAETGSAMKNLGGIVAEIGSVADLIQG
ncbi:HAMP domain-containing protein, partial [Azospirillum oleiclasticum]